MAAPLTTAARLPRRALPPCFVAALAFGPTTGCEATEPTLPPLPAALRTYDEYPFGDATAARSEWAISRVWCDLKPRHPGLREEGHAVEADADLAALRAGWGRALTALGWRPLDRLRDAAGRGAWVEAHESGRRVAALVGLLPRADGGSLLPVTLLTDLPRPRRSPP